MMALGGVPLIAFLATVDSERCKAFYGEVLGLRLVDDSPFALEFDSGGTMLRIQKVDEFTPQPFTALGWEAGDIDTQIAELAKQGVRFERFAGMEQDEAGVWTAPSHARIAWFRDPDGNLLSLTEFP
jgi:catechol 2,3-dioxygenase-like lactoylglutathione lyase family enzyme